jgi:hypothetical protein
MILDSLLSALIINIIVFAFCSLVAFLISFFSYKTFKLTKESKYAYFSLGFIFLSIGLILHAIGNLSFYFGIEKCLNATCNISQQTLYFAHLIHIILTFIAYVILILIYFKVKEKVFVALAFIQAFILAVLTFSSYMFNVVGFILSLFIVYGAYRTYKSNKTRNTKLALVAFSLISLSHILFLYGNMIPAYSSLFLGFLSFLFIFKKHGSKKK